jgi:hypothetical protein
MFMFLYRSGSRVDVTRGSKTGLMRWQGVSTTQGCERAFSSKPTQDHARLTGLLPARGYRF